jgi:predicted GNAT family acetyltransferase
MAEAETSEVVLNPSEERWQVTRGDDVAFLSYMRHEQLLYLTHTEVPNAFRGEGLGRHLVHAAMDFARAEALTVVPFCPFARKYLEQHRAEYDGLVRWE